MCSWLKTLSGLKKVYDLKYDSKSSLIVLWGYYLDTLGQGMISEA